MFNVKLESVLDAEMFVRDFNEQTGIQSHFFWINEARLQLDGPNHRMKSAQASCEGMRKGSPHILSVFYCSVKEILMSF